MKYFIDSEFLEGPQTLYQWGLKTDTWLRIFATLFFMIGIYLIFDEKSLAPLPFFIAAVFMGSFSFSMTPPTIDLISIGIVSEEGKELYAISKDFNLKEAWNRYQLIPMTNIGGIGDTPTHKKEYWIRENVLRPIFEELRERSLEDEAYIKAHFYTLGGDFTYKHLKSLIKHYGWTNEEIARMVKEFCVTDTNGEKPEFYGYYADYDWVVFCWLFGRMIDLPDNFPMYCKDLKQISDELYLEVKESYEAGGGKNFIEKLSLHQDYPKQGKEHIAIADARWNELLFIFLHNVQLELNTARANNETVR